jgi:hypothetical protein
MVTSPVPSPSRVEQHVGFAKAQQVPAPCFWASELWTKINFFLYKSLCLGYFGYFVMATEKR